MSLKMWFMHSSLLIPLAVAVSIAVASGCQREVHVDSPQLAFDSYKTASQSNDWIALYSALSPGYRDYMIFESVFAMEMNPNKESSAIISKYVDHAKLEKLFIAHKQPLSTEETISIYSQAIKSKEAMFTDCLKYLQKNSHDDPADNQKFGPLLALEVSGNAATATSTVTSTIVSYSRSPDDTKDIRHEQEVNSDVNMYFVKLNGKWVYSTLTEWQEHKSQDSSK